MTAILLFIFGVICLFGAWKLSRRKAIPVDITMSATVKPYKCSFNRLLACDEKEATIWIGEITVGNFSVWGTKQMESTSREAATAALLNALSKGVTIPALVIQEQEQAALEG